jgi:predicted Fe-Mo cluster-binding NifX family protein
MKIAVPTRQGFVDDQLGLCEAYTIYTIDENYEIASQDFYQPSESCCCRTNTAAHLRQQGVSVVLAGHVEPVMVQRLSGSGLEIVRDCHGEVEHVVRNYLDKLPVVSH